MRSPIRTSLKFLAFVLFAGWLVLTAYQVIRITEMAQASCRIAQYARDEGGMPKDQHIDVVQSCPRD